MGVGSSLIATIRVLFWKNWRTRARESVLNKRRPTTNGVWLFPPMILDTIIPLILVVGLVYLFCSLNEQISSGVSDGIEGKVIAPYVTLQTTIAGMTMLPLLLAKTNKTILFVDRPETRSFVSYLDTEIAHDRELGLYPISTYVQWFPVQPVQNLSELDLMIEKYVKKASVEDGISIYAAVDLRRSDPLKPLKARLFFDQDDNVHAQAVAPTDQVKNYWQLTVHDADQDRYIRFPQTLPFMNTLNMYLRTRTSGSEITPPSPTTIALSPKKACRELSFVLEDANLRLYDLESSGGLGNTTDTCVEALQARKVKVSTLRFLHRLIQQRDEEDQLFSFGSAVLPKKPQKLIHGELESNIVMYMAFLFLWPYNRLTRDIVLEKEKQLKEYLLIMGVPPMASLVSWFLLYWGAVLVVVIFATYILSDVMFEGTFDSQVGFFLLMGSFSTSVLLFGVAITPMFNKTTTAGAVAPILYMLMSAVGMIRGWVGDQSMFTPVVDLVEQASAPRVYMDTLRDIAALNATNGKLRPIEWTTVEGPLYRIVCQCAFYLLMGWYFENVFPRAFGVQQPWYFIISPSYWFPSRRVVEEEKEEAPLLDGTNDKTLREMPLTDYVLHFRPILLVHNLWKRYSNGTLAVKNVSFAVKKGEIFGLLGPNGAGKSTTLSILCGMYTPTQGDAYVGTTSVKSSPSEIRKSLSVCFQQNILYDSLTVWEHLQLVYDLKTALGVSAIDSETWMGKLQHFGMEEKKDSLSQTLSGGQKRKLSLVLALMDQSRVVLLDEPTAGMDLKARVDTWDALKRAVQHRAVILTTHSMQEAQALCENIGIVADGEMKCCGSSLFLREKYGVGYKLTIVHGNDKVKTETLLKGVQRHVSSAIVASCNKWETRLQLNTEDASLMIPFFDELDRMKQSGTIKSYSVTATDLEDVFVRVTEGDDVYNHAADDVDSEELKPKALEPVEMKSSVENSTERLSNVQATRLQLGALLNKRVLMIKRAKRSFFTQYIWPLILFGFLVRTGSRTLDKHEPLDVLTTLPATASKALTFIGSVPSAASSTKEILAAMNSTDRSRVVFEVIDTSQTMIDHMFEKEPNYFSAILIKNVTWPSANHKTGTLDYSVFYNDTIPHSLFVSVDWVSQAYCKAIGKTDCKVDITKTAFPSRSSGFTLGSGQQLYAQKKLEEKSKEDKPLSARMSYAFYILITLSSITSVYVSAVVKEREMGLKRMQYLHLSSNQPSLIYWLAHFIFDYGIIVISTVIMFAFTYFYGMQWSNESMIVVVLATFLFGISIIAFSYFISLVFGSHSTAQAVMSYLSCHCFNC